MKEKGTNKKHVQDDVRVNIGGEFPKEDRLFEQSIEALKRKLPSVNPNNFRIVFMGDSWTGDGHSSNDMFEEALKVARDLDPLAIFHGGDAVWTGSQQQFQTGTDLFYGHLRSFREQITRVFGNNIPPFFVTPGNHDSSSPNSPAFEAFTTYIGPLRFSIHIPKLSMKFIGLMTNFEFISSLGHKIYYLDNTNLEFLRNNLGGTVEQNTFVGMHVPPDAGKWTKFQDPESTFDIGLKQFLEFIHKKVAKVLVSHVHMYDIEVIQGIEYILSGGAGAPLVTGQTNHIVVIEVKNGVMSHRKVNIGWTA